MLWNEGMLRGQYVEEYREQMNGLLEYYFITVNIRISQYNIDTDQHAIVFHELDIKDCIR